MEMELAQTTDYAKELVKGNERVVEAPAFSVARNIIQRDQSRKMASTLRSIDKREHKNDATPLLHMDYRVWASGYSGVAFNFIHCDFPYGVGADKHAQGAAKKMGSYTDTEEEYWELINTLVEYSHNFIADSAHLMFWFSMDYYHDTKTALEIGGWRVNPFPLIWHKSDNAGILPDPKRGPRRTYETAFIAAKGDRNIVQAVANSFASPTTKLIHMSEKPVPVLTHFMRMFVDEYTIMLDPTCGSANAVRVASKGGAASVLGLEKDQTFYELAKEHFNDPIT